MLFFLSHRGAGGTCPGDSGAPLLADEELEIEGDLEIVTKQVAVLHGSLEQCANRIFPAIYVRLTNPRIHQWLRSKIDIPAFWPDDSKPIGN